LLAIVLVVGFDLHDGLNEWPAARVFGVVFVRDRAGVKAQEGAVLAEEPTLNGEIWGVNLCHDEVFRV
jgi:hypothetical protein